MRMLFIIGNGFDLAHKLPTKYVDFLIWYWNKLLKQEQNGTPLGSQIFGFSKTQHLQPIQDEGDFSNRLKGNGIEVHSELIRNLLNDYQTLGTWSNFEHCYFLTLQERLDQPYKNGITQLDKRRQLIRSLRKINNELGEFVREFTNYLSEVVHPIVSQTQPHPEFLKIFFNGDEDRMFLDFNYTGLLSKYISQGLKTEKNTRIQHVQIHGQANPSRTSESPPIIFGFGDDNNDTYRRILELEEMWLLSNFKTNIYNHYSKQREELREFMFRGSGQALPFHAHIIGHSCAKTDYSLLSEIFAKSLCDKIIYHHYPNQASYTQMTANLRRYFQEDQTLESRIHPFDHALKCPQFKS